MNLEETLQRLESLGDEKLGRLRVRQQAGENQFGVKLGDIRKLAKEIKSNQELGLELWETGNADAQLLSILLFKPKKLSVELLDQMVRQISCEQVADWFSAYIIKKHPEKETLREMWMATEDPMAARAGWAITEERVAKNREALDLSSLLNRIETEMGDANPLTQWTMNNTLVGIGIHSPEHRDRAIAIGETLGIYRDFPVSKGCTSPFAPIWINEMVSRQT